MCYIAKNYRTHFFILLEMVRQLEILISTVSTLIIATDKAEKTGMILIRSRGYKTFFMLNSAEHEILNAHKYKKRAQISIECYFSCS